MCFFQHINVTSTSISREIEVHTASSFHFSVSIDVFDHFNAPNIKKGYFRSVNNPITYKLVDASEKIVPHFVTSL